MPDFQNITSRAEARKARRRAFLRRRIALISVVASTLAVFGGLVALESDAQRETLAVNQTPNDPPVAVASEQTEVAEETEAVLGDEPIDVLLLGIDKRPEDMSEEEGVRADAIIVARVIPETGDIRLLSIPRDLYVEVEPGGKDRINSAYALGGVDQARSVVERYTGVGIDHYAIIDFGGFEEGVDALGGVRVNVKEGEYPDYWNIEPGKQKLNGKRALMYARYRDSVGGDLDRIGHQQQILTAVKNKALSLGTVTRLPELMEVAEGNVESDVGPRDAIALARALAATQKESGATVESYTIKGEGTFLDDGRQVLTPLDEENQEIISDFLG
ncbi:MAG: LCP family protein [Rubrobacter sp.]